MANNFKISWVVGWVLLAALMALPVSAREVTVMDGQSTFASPEAAVTALVVAVREDDLDKLLAIFGPEAEELVFSGDPVADRQGRQKFLKAHAAKHFLETRDGRVVLYVGDRDYPFPIPLAVKAGAWFFDTGSGREEILNRRIGRNELRTIETLHAYTAAQRDYACRISQEGDPAQFAQRLVSSEGGRDGLYWPAGEGGETESPFGPLIAAANEAGYDSQLGEEAEPFHGYFFRILTSQGSHASGGAFDYLVNGKMVLGFGMVAYPARYGSTGVKSFMVNQEGVIYEKDLGPESGEAATMTTFDPDETWRRTVAEKEYQE